MKEVILRDLYEEEGENLFFGVLNDTGDCICPNSATVYPAQECGKMWNIVEINGECQKFPIPGLPIVWRRLYNQKEVLSKTIEFVRNSQWEKKDEAIRKMKTRIASIDALVNFAKAQGLLTP